ncbi:MAG TPA: TIR domain-containing protein [Rhizomicrobium sp.]|nr:TIR domain-containing protein [Rhizomicrobium sp.]
MSRPKIFISSATPRLAIATALHARLERDFHVQVWDQHGIPPSEYPIPALLKHSRENDFAIQIIAHDVIQRDDQGEFFAPNPNVLIEIGIFMGALGQKRVFLLAPSSHSSIRIPSDLGSLTLVTYDEKREDENLEAAVGPAAFKIRQEIERQWPEVYLERSRQHQVNLFPDIDFRPLVAKAEELTCCFVHSRRWRENHGEAIAQRMHSGQLKKLQLMLPNIRDEPFIRDLASRFDDEPSIPGMLLDAFVWIKNLSDEFGPKVKISLFSKVPVYSFYRFQSSAVIAFYPLARVRRPSPTLIANSGDEVWDFISQDMAEYEKECVEVFPDQLVGLIGDFQRKFHLKTKAKGSRKGAR